MQGRARIGDAFVVLSVTMLVGCNSAEEKALAKERLDLVKMEAAIVDGTPKNCAMLKTKLDAFDTANKDRISAVNTKWAALSDSKRKSLSKALREEQNPYYDKLIPVTIQCGDIWPVK